MTQVLGYITQNYTLFLFGGIIILLAVIGYYAEKTNFGQGKTDKTKDAGPASKEIDLNNTSVMDVINDEGNIQSNTDNFIKDENVPISNISSDVNLTKNEGETNKEIDLNNTSVMDVTNNDEGNIQSNTDNFVKNENVPISNINADGTLTKDEVVDAGIKLIEKDENLIAPVEEKEEIVNPIIDAIHKELNLVSNDAIYNVEEIKKKETKNKKREEAFNKFSDEFDALLPKREIISDDLLSEIEDLELGKTQKFNLKDLKRFDNIKLPRISDTATEDQDIWRF